MPDTYSAGTAFITVVPSFLGIEDAFRKQVGQMAKAVDKDLAAGMARGLKEAERQAGGAGTRAGVAYASAHEGAVKKHLNAAWRSLPVPDPDVKLTKWEKALAAVRAEMKELSEQRIGIDIDQKTFDKAVDDARKKLVDLRTFASGPNRERNFFNADQALGHIGNLQQFTGDLGRRAGEAGEQAGSAFNQRMAKVLRDGLGKIPPIRLTADSSDAERSLEGLRRRMVELESKRIGVDISAEDAYAQLRAINSELQRLDRASIRVDIRTNAHEAAAGITQFVQQAEQAGRSTQGIGQRANFTLSRMERLVAVGASLGTAIVPAALSAAAAVGAIGTAGIAAMAGLGVLALGTSGIAGAVKALNGYQEDQAKSANSVNQAQRRMAGSTNQVRMAQLSLANTRRNLAEQEEDAARRVADAERAVSDTRRQARRDLLDQARSLRDSQRAVTDAEEDARDVRRSLNDVIRDATRDIQELDGALRRNGVDQQKAVTAQLEALEELNALRANPRATEVELRRAQDSYDEQTVRLEELRQKQKELSEDKERADKLGVEGDKQVVQARERVADADERVAKARERVVREQEQLREVEYRSQQRIADSQRSLDDARRQQGRQALDAQFQLAQASEALADAQRGQAQAWEQTGVAGGAALEKLNEEMADLSPAGQQFARFIHGLKDEARGLRDAAAEPFLPKLQTAITMLLPYLPAVEKFIGKVASAMGDMAIAAVESFGNPVWQKFFGYVDKSVVPSLMTMFEVGSNVAEGLISLFLALSPFNEDIGSGLVNMSRDFAQWAERLDKTQGFQDFLEYVRTNGPRVVEFLGNIGELFINLVQAAAPLGAVMLVVLNAVVEFFNAWPPELLTAFVIGLGAAALGVTVLGAAMRAVKFRDQLRDIVSNSNAYNKYAVETGRAADRTTLFGKVAATTGGMAAAAGTRVQGMATAVGNLGTRMGAANTGAGPLGRNLDAVRVAAMNASIAVNGPNGLAGGIHTATTRVGELGTAAGVAAAGGLAQARTSMLEVATAANGPGGVAAGAQTAGQKIAGMGRAAGGAAKSIGGKLLGGLSSLGGFLGGPWGIALTAASLGLMYFTTKSEDQKESVDSLSTALLELGKKYRELGPAGRAAGSAGAKALEDMVSSNPELQQAVIALDKLGVGLEDIGTIATGDTAAGIKAINDEIARLNKLEAEEAVGRRPESGVDFSAQVKEWERYRDTIADTGRKSQTATQALEILQKQTGRAAAMAAIAASSQGKSAAHIKSLADAWDHNESRIQNLNRTLAIFRDGQGGVAAKVEWAKQKIDESTGATIGHDRATEGWDASLRNLRTSVENSGSALKSNTDSAAANREAIKTAATAARDLFLQELAMGGKLPEVTKKHDDRIRALKQEAKDLGLDKTKTAELIKVYGDVPEEVKTRFMQGNFDDVYNELIELNFMQGLIKQGIPPSSSEAKRLLKEHLSILDADRRLLNRMRAANNYTNPTPKGQATGGPIHGPGTKTSDSVPIMASRGEFMQQASAVDYYGTDVMWALNNKLIPKEALPGFKSGGPIRWNRLEAPIKIGLKSWIPSLEEAESLALSGMGGIAALGSLMGKTGYQWQTQVLRKVFPGMPVYSDYRPGSTTASGELSWHARDGGRAVDVPPRRKIFDWIRANYGANSQELIWGGAPDLNIYKGKPYRFADSLLYRHGPYKGKDGPSPHIHWAFDNGGWLMPGAGQYLNMTGQPEAVLTPNQWNIMENFIQQGMAGGKRETHHHWDFANSTLDERRFRDIQARDDAVNRVERPY